MRQSGLEYVDKSDLIRQIVDRAGVQVLLFPRPRRFGKTLNLSMLRCWFEKQDTDLSHLFEGLSIWQAGEVYRAHFQRYPVIHFNFKGSKGATFEPTLAAIRKKIGALFDEHRALLSSEKLSERQLRGFRAILDGTAEQALYEGALLDLSEYLHAHHGEKVVILIDEYDEPIHAGHVHGYSAQILDFMRTFLGEGLKSNVHLHKAVVTGILRVAKENLFSGLNNLDVYATTFRGWMEQRLRASGGNLAALTTALLGGDAETVEEELQGFVTNVHSYHDPGTLRPERVYHGAQRVVGGREHHGEARRARVFRVHRRARRRQPLRFQETGRAFGSPLTEASEGSTRDRCKGGVCTPGNPISCEGDECHDGGPCPQRAAPTSTNGAQKRASPQPSTPRTSSMAR